MKVIIKWTQGSSWVCDYCGGTTIASSTYTDYCADCGEVFQTY